MYSDKKFLSPTRKAFLMGLSWLRAFKLSRSRRLWGRIVGLIRAFSEQRILIASLVSFIRSQPIAIQRRLLTEMDPGRVFSLVGFQAFAAGHFKNVGLVAVVSGSEKEPELLFLPPTVQVTQLNFSDDPDLFDLGKDWSGSDWSAHHGRYDLVLCEQVLEHVVDPGLAVKNLSKILSPNGFLHLGVPSVNNRHGEPTFFYAGFALEALDYWLRNAGLELREASSWNSDKGSRMYSTTDWAPLAQSGPIVYFLLAVILLRKDPKQLFQTVGGRIRNCIRYPGQNLFTVRKTGNAVVSWVFGAKSSVKSVAQ